MCVQTGDSYAPSGDETAKLLLASTTLLNTAIDLAKAQWEYKSHCYRGRHKVKVAILGDAFVFT